MDDTKFTSQAEALARLFSGKNIFLSGPAGSGKTFLISHFLDWLDAEFEGRVNVAITASTGIAAQLLGGKTIHSWSGIGINNDSFKQPTPGEWAARDRLEAVDVLIIDEISMLPAYLFTRLDKLLRFMRKSKEPFGGVQIVVMGDFMQLPPVGRKGETNSDGEEVDSGFCIRTESWKSASFRALYLDKVRRARDPKLKRVLASIAADKVDDKTRELVKSRLGATRDPDKKYMVLFTTNKNVDKYNDDRLAENPNQLHFIPVKCFGLADPEKNLSRWKAIKKSYGLPDACRLKIGATVMLTANLPEGHSNGSLGEVTGIDSEGATVRFNDGISEYISFREYAHKEKVLVKTEKRKGKDVEVFEDQVVAQVFAIPLKLGYSISVHKSQGQTFEAVEADLSYIFAAGLGYVALSRVASLDHLILTGNRIHPDVFKVDQNSLRYSKATKKAAHGRRQEMNKNLEDAEKYLAEFAAKSGAPVKVEPVAQLEAAETTKVEAPQEDPFANFDVEQPQAEVQSTYAIGIDPDHEEVEDDEPYTGLVFPAGFLSYKQLLTNPYARSAVWDKKVSDRNARMARAAARGYYNKNS